MNVAILRTLLLPTYEHDVAFYFGLAIMAAGAVAAALPYRDQVIAKAARVTKACWRPIAFSVMAFGLILAASTFVNYDPGDSRSDRTYMDIQTLEIAVKTYKLKTGANPQRLDGVLKYIDGATASNLNDAWGRRFDYDPDGPRNGGKQPDIWTVSPNGVLICNWIPP